VTTDAFAQRREIAAAALASHKIDALLVTHLPNIRYLTGFTGSNAALLLSEARADLFTDPRYTIQAAQQVSCRVRIARGPLLERVVERVSKLHLKRLGFESTQLRYDQHTLLAEHLPAAVKFRPCVRFVEDFRMIKSDAEIDLIRKSVATNSAALEEALKTLRPGLTESAFAAEIDYRSRQLDAEAPAFETIVASGARAALPHARPEPVAMAAGTVVLIDMGALRAGYCSDMTRMFHLGQVPANVASAYQATLDAQLAAVAAVRAGVTSGDVDRAARRVLKSAGLAANFVHSTGHGLGLEIHEAPRIGSGDRTELKAGMVITIEPGVYFENEFGIRIEDTVVVTEDGCEVLTPTSKELRVLA
jgi:Xaa-Pro aminopeptidase